MSIEKSLRNDNKNNTWLGFFYQQNMDKIKTVVCQPSENPPEGLKSYMSLIFNQIYLESFDFIYFYLKQKFQIIVFLDSLKT